MPFIRPIARSRPPHRRLLAQASALVLLTAAAFLLLAWYELHEAGKPLRAGRPLNPYVAAAHVVAARADVMLGDTRGAQKHVDAIAHDVARSARIIDVSHPIDHEAARVAVRSLSGVRAAIWLDTANLAIMVDGARYRSRAMIDTVCDALVPLGDTLAVVVHVQDATATNADGATTLSRNCQLPEGERALFQRKRNIDVVAPELRSAFKAQQAERR
ncbi:MAG: hypothetical protein ABW186_18650 [Rhodanobacteraceae bacterium]